MKKLLSIALLAGTLAFSGCGDDDEFVVINPTNPIPAPVCVDDAYTGSSNQPLIVNAATGVLANDTPNGATVTFQAASANGGTIVGAQDGSFTYTPAANFIGADTFTYTLGNSGGVVTCTVTVTVNAVNGFFVDATNGNDGTGSFTNGLPFATVQAALTAAPAGSDIVVRPGNYTGAVNLDNGDRLLGSGSVLAQGTPARPVLTGPVVMGDGCTLDYLRIANSPDDGVNADNQAGGTITNCEIDTVGTNMQGVSAAQISGTWTISNNAIANTSGVGLTVQTVGTSSLTLRAENNQFINDAGAMVFVSEGTSNLSASVKGNTFTNSQGVGSAFEATCGGDSTFCLDLESNMNDDQYRLVESITPSEMTVEQLSTLTDAQPGGAGNTGVVSVATGALFDPISEGLNGACGF